MECMLDMIIIKLTYISPRSSSRSLALCKIIYLATGLAYLDHNNRSTAPDRVKVFCTPGTFYNILLEQVVRRVSTSYKMMIGAKSSVIFRAKHQATTVALQQVQRLIGFSYVFTSQTLR